MGTDSKKDRSLRGLSERFVQLFFAEKVSLGLGAGAWGLGAGGSFPGTCYQHTMTL